MEGSNVGGMRQNHKEIKGDKRGYRGKRKG